MRVMRVTSIKLATLATIAVGGALALPSSAGAAISCDFTDSVLSVTLDANGDFPIIDRSGDNIRVMDNLGPDPVCTGGTATVMNTEHIEVDQPGAGQTAQPGIDLSGGPFEPGTGGPAEGGGTSEIEFEIDLGDGFDTLHVFPRADPFSDHFRFGDLGGGDSGANLNAPEAGGPDGDDLRLTNVDSITVTLGFGETIGNTYDGSGGPEFAGPLSTIHVSGLGGGAGPDTVSGGDRGGIYDGFGGDDTLLSSRESLFNETLRGGENTDTLDYSRATGGVTIELGVSAGQDTGGGGFDVLDQTDFENLTGGSFGDTLTGTDTANRIVGAGGTDTLDLLDGADQFEVMDGLADTVDCGDGADSGVADEQGVDAINANCETVDFPPQTSIASGPAGGATITDRTPTYGLTADEAATFERRVDGGAFEPCPASCTIPSLSSGPHTLAFRATDQDPPASPDPSPATRTVTITSPSAPPGPPPPSGDTDPPETQITKGPKRKTRKKVVELRFVSDEADASFECALDEADFSPCNSPLRVRAKKKGKHTFGVRATDEAGNRDDSPAEQTWKRKKRKRR